MHARQAPPAAVAHQATLDRYCATCHSQRLKTAGVVFERIDLSRLPDNVDLWEKTIRKLRAGMMPPPGAPRPEPRAVEALASWLETSLDAASAAAPDPGRVPLHRLNRAEYANAVEDLLGIRVDASALLPKDDEANGFDNIAAALRVSPSFLDQYVTAARLVTIRALGSPDAKPSTSTYRPARGTDQTRRVEGLPPGTRGGLIVEHLFPSDGDYKFSVSGLAGAFYIRGVEYQHTLIVTVDGRKVFEGTIGGEDDMRAIDQKQAPAVAAINARFQNIVVPVKAGPHKVGVTFVARSYAESDEVLYSLKPGALEDRIPRVAGVDITGPFAATGIGSTPSRERIFVCRPAPSAPAATELACARRIVSSFARRAYRRPVTERDLEAPLAFYREGRSSADFETGIQRALTVILASPKFLFRADQAPPTAGPGAVYRLNGFDLASRLSFFLTGSVPDEPLIQAALAGRLVAPQEVERQVRRLLADPRSKTLVTTFAFQWLKLRGVDDIDPDMLLFPAFDAALREAFKREVGLFVESVVGEDRSVVDLLTADHTFVNERLALHYGIPQVRGETFRRVSLADPNRRGLLGKGAVLMATSYGNRTAPVLRGAWILENVVGTPPASPPPDVEGFPENKAGEKARSVRDIMEQHRAKPSCNACHGVMDPLGFALENFDAIGAWRTRDREAGSAIDASGVLVDGTPVSNPRQLTDALVRRPEQFVQTFTEKLLTYALGRGLEARDMPTVRAIVRRAARDQYRFSSIVLGIVTSAPFQMSRRSAVPDTTQAARGH